MANEFPWAEAYPERAAAAAQREHDAYLALRTALPMGFPARGGAAAGGFARLRALVGARNAAQARRLAEQNAAMEGVLESARSAIGPRPGPELAAELERLGGVSRPSAFRSLLERSQAGEIDRPWVGTKSIYQTEGQRILPKSYRNPRTYELPE